MDEPASPRLSLSVQAGVSGVSADAWNALVAADDPFLEHAFLSALEQSGSVGPGTGWEPRFLLAHDGSRLVGAVPLYLKDDSMGEFIWDFAWAEGAWRAGIPYYPKLVAAVPFTPATGQRLLVHPEADRAAIQPLLIHGTLQVARELDAHSVHVLFCLPGEMDALAMAGLIPRASYQHQWHNRDATPYEDFDDYLGTFRSRNRKQVRHERAAIQAHGLRILVARGDELDDTAWAALDRFYRTTNDKHGNTAPLTPEFFHRIRRTHGHRVLAALAYRGDTPVAGTINFFRGDRLSGRYWGCDDDVPLLHFELCFYRLIDYAIAHRLRVFEGGAGGEQKLKRGLLPRPTHSAHFFRHPGLSRAIGEFVAIEARHVESTIQAELAHTPFAEDRAARGKPW